MTKRRLSKRGLLTIAVLGLAVSGAVLSQFPNTDNYEVRTMKVVEVKNEITYLKDGNGEVYGMYDKVYNRYEDLLVTIDNQGTQNLKDDVIVNWRYKN